MKNVNVYQEKNIKIVVVKIYYNNIYNYIYYYILLVNFLILLT